MAVQLFCLDYAYLTSTEYKDVFFVPKVRNIRDESSESCFTGRYKRTRPRSKKTDEFYFSVSHNHRYSDFAAFCMDISQLPLHRRLQATPAHDPESESSNRLHSDRLDHKPVTLTYVIVNALSEFRMQLQASALRLLQDHLPGVSYRVPGLHVTRSRAYPVGSCFLYSDP